MKLKKKIDVLFVLPSLRSGGAERVMSFLAQNLDPTIFNTHLLITGTNVDQKYEVTNIPLTFLNKNRVKQAVPNIIQHIFKHKPKIVISAIGHLNMVIGLIGIFFPTIKFVARATTISGFNMSHEVQGNKKTSTLYRLAFKFLDKIVCQSNDMKNALVDNYSIPISKIVVINNPVTSKFRLKNNHTEKPGLLKLITIGRLTERKGYERIINVLPRLDQPFHYTIIGSGENEQNILDLITNLKLKDQITLIPHTNRINDYLAENDIYLQGSYVEGFPNALLESCATGTPAVVYNAPGGINEIIIPGRNGYIANNPVEFLEKLKIATAKNWSPNDIRETVYSRYSEQKILSYYEKFFQELATS